MRRGGSGRRGERGDGVRMVKEGIECVVKGNGGRSREWEGIKGGEKE